MDSLTPDAGSYQVPDELVAVILDPTAYADDRIYGAYAWLRTNNPVGLVSHPDFDPFWVVTRYKDVQQVGLDNNTFRSGELCYNLLEKKSIEHAIKINAGKPNLIDSIVAMDAPEHGVYRRLTQAWFMGSNLKKRESEIRDIARKAVQRLVEHGQSCDFVTDFATGYPLRVIMNILGVPEEDEPLMLRLTQQNFGTKDPDLSGAAEVMKAEQYADFMHGMVSRFSDYFRVFAETKRKHPTEDLTSIIANATIDGAPIPVETEIGYYITIVTGGHDTTSSSIAAAMWQLAKNPAAFAALKANLSLIPNVVDEGVRWATPVKHFMRSASRDTLIGERAIAKGDWIMLCYASANRDEAAFPDADVFKIARPPARHLGFGYGPHLCLGQHLAKMEMRILLEELLPRIKSVALNGEPANSVDWFVNGPKSLPVTFAFE